MKTLISRRKLLQMMPITLLTPVLLKYSANMKALAQPSDQPLLIIGAGMAGLSAARLLHDAGYQVKVIEGRERAGGRIWTNRELGLPLDLGASWIHGVNNNPVQQLARDFGIETLVTDYDSIRVYYTDGTIIDDSDLEYAFGAFVELIETLDGAREELDSDTSLANGIETLLAEEDLSAEERKLADYIITTFIEHDIATDASELSLWYWDQDGEFGGRDELFPGGYDQIVNRLAEGLDIRYNEIVERVTYSENGVVVNTANNTYEGQRAIVTLPLGVLKQNRVAFSPALPSSKQQAIQRLNMGVLNKVYLRFPQAFWDTEPHFVGYIPARKGEWVSWMNLHRYIQEPILLAFNSGQFAKQLEGLTDEQIVEQGMSALRSMYGSSIPNPTNWLITRWTQDPFAYGSYSHIPVGASGEDYDRLAEPVANRLFFAGEATSREYPSTVHGALLSGWREAQRIMAL